MNFLATRLAVWLLTLVLFPVPVTVLARSFQVEVLQRITVVAALPQERPYVQEQEQPAQDLAERILLHLEQAEKTEIDPWLRDDIRIAWITVAWSQTGVPDWSWHRDSTPYVAATYQVLQCLPDEVWPRIVRRRHEMLRAEYADFFPEASSPKKPVQSVRLPRREEREG